MFENLSPQEKKTLKIGGAIIGVGLLALAIKNIADSRSGLPENDPNSVPGLPLPDGSGTNTSPTPPAELWNINTPLCYKSPYTRMVKVLQTGINTIAKKVGEKTIKVDGKFGPDTLKKVHSYFNSECVNLDRLNTRLQTLRAQDNSDTWSGSGGTW